MYAHSNVALSSGTLDRGVSHSPDALLTQLLAGPAEAPAARPPWAAPARLAPARSTCAAGPAWGAPRRGPRPAIAAAATLLLAGGIVVASVGAAPVSAARAPEAVAAAIAPASGALAGLSVASAAPADGALLASLLAAPTAEDEALLTSLLAAPARAAALPAFELAAEPAAAAPDARLAAASALPSSAFSYTLAKVDLPAVTLEAQRATYLPPPAPANQIGSAQGQPPPPAGYVQPPGYQDGVPFGGQPGAVPAARPSRPAAPRPAAQPAPRPSVATSYTVRAGDTLASIALRYYGDARYAATIWDVNYRSIGANPNTIYPGQRLTLPAVAGRPAVGAPLPARGSISQRANYTIQPRDFLRWMSERAYGNERFWPEIYQANRNVLGPNPDLIYPGVTVYIP